MTDASAIKRATSFLLLLPRNCAVLVLRGYRAGISPLYGDVCRYYPSCSRYTLEAIQEYGLIRGGALGAWRILRCHPWAKGGVDDVPHRHQHGFTETAFGFVVSSGHGKAPHKPMNLTSFISTISVVLWPIKWVIELLLVSFHTGLTALGMNPSAGITWILAILGLVIVVRSALIPVFVRQIKSQRRMLEIAPKIKKIQDKYKGKKDQYSREAMSRETMALYKDTGTNPLSSCLPLLLQMPVFLSLTATLNGAQHDLAGVGLLNKQLASQFGHATFFGLAPLNASLSTAGHNGWVWVIGVSMIVLMSATQFITQLQIMSKNQTPEMKASPTYRQQRILLYILPFIFIFSGFSFPLGVMFYWVFGNLWTMGQQFIVIRNLPQPGSDAALAREERLARRRQRRPQVATEGAGGVGGFSIVEEPKKPVTTQRTQPVGKNRSKKSGNKK